MDLSEASRGHLVDLAVAAERVKAWAVAVQAKVTVALVEQFETAHEAVCVRDREVAHDQAVEATSLSLSLALGVSLRAADKKVALAQGLDAHPTRGRRAGARAHRRGPGGRDLRPRGGTAAAQGGPSGPVSRHGPGCGSGRRDRDVAHHARTIDRPAALVLHGPDELLAATYAHLDHQARTARNAGAPETLDQLRFDLAVGHLTAGAFGLTLTAKSRPTDSADCNAGTTTGKRRWRRRWRGTTLINVTATDVSTGYRPGTRIAELCRVRDGHTSRFPTSAARTLELDHLDEYDHTDPANGGPTTPANLATASATTKPRPTG